MSTSDTTSAAMPTSDAKERCDTHPSVMFPANAILFAIAPPHCQQHVAAGVLVDMRLFYV